MLGNVVHHPSERKKYEIDYSAWMDTANGELLSAVAITISPNTTTPLQALAVISADQLKVELTVFAGEAENQYEVGILSTTSFNQTDRECLGVTVSESC